MAQRGRRLGTMAFWGAFGGGINALLCYAHLPAPIMTGESVFGGSSPIEFPWTVIPGGAAHGAILAVAGVWTAARIARYPILIRAMTAAIAGWIAGWISWIALSTGMLMNEWPEILVWPFQQGWWQPWCYFGLVTTLCIAGLSMRPNWPGTQLIPHLLVGIISGVLGSLWWWIMSTPWHFSLLHGTIWGALVGYGAWSCERDGELA